MVWTCSEENRGYIGRRMLEMVGRYGNGKEDKMVKPYLCTTTLPKYLSLLFFAFILILFHSPYCFVLVAGELQQTVD